jgi:hypothetical protein
VKKATFIIAMLLTAAVIAASDFRPALEYVREAALPDGKSSPETFYAITLDEDLYNRLNGIYSNLRIYDSNGQQTPFIIRQKFTTALRQTETTYNAKVESLTQPEPEKGNRLELVISGPKPDEVKVFAAESITINTPATNFEKSVTVYGSADGRNWKLLAGGIKIYDYSSIAGLRNTELEIPNSESRFFKLELLNFSEIKQQSGFSQLVKSGKDGNATETSRFYERQDFKIDSIILTAKSAKQQISIPATQEVNAEFSMSQESDGKQIFAVHTSSSPVVSFCITTSSQNFARDCKLEFSNDNKNWRHLTTGRIFSYSLPGIDRSDLALSVPATRAPYYRLTVFNKDNPLLQNVKIVLTADIYHAVFLSGAAALPVKLYYGGSNIPAPQYDIQEILGSQSNLSCSELRLSPPQKNPEFKGKPAEPDKTWFNIAMYTAFALAAIALIAILVVCMRKFEQTQAKND